jgi:hypothetical protein
VYSERGAWRIGYPLAEPYLLDLWSSVGSNDGKPFRWTMAPRTRALVPNLMPNPQRLGLWLAPAGSRDVTLRWDGDVVARAHLEDGWQKVEFEVRDMPVGEHELMIEAELAVRPSTQLWPAPKRPVGVAVNALELELIRV